MRRPGQRAAAISPSLSEAVKLGFIDHTHSAIYDVMEKSRSDLGCEVDQGSGLLIGPEQARAVRMA